MTISCLLPNALDIMLLFFTTLTQVFFKFSSILDSVKQYFFPWCAELAQRGLFNIFLNDLDYYRLLQTISNAGNLQARLDLMKYKSKQLGTISYKMFNLMSPSIVQKNIANFSDVLSVLNYFYVVDIFSSLAVFYFKIIYIIYKILSFPPTITFATYLYSKFVILFSVLFYSW